jgi:ABC-type antimicrobial peptide transport system permease subunit
MAPSEPSVLGGAAAVMFAAALAACWFPARRAMRLDPIASLRDD